MYLKLEDVISNKNQYILQKANLEGNWSYQAMQASVKAKYIFLFQSPCLQAYALCQS